MYLQVFFVHISNHLFFTVKNIVVNRDTWIKSSPFPCSFLLTGPRQLRAFWADLQLHWQGPSRRHPRKLLRTRQRQVKSTYFDQLWLFHLTKTGFWIVFADDDERALVNELYQRTLSKYPNLGLKFFKKLKCREMCTKKPAFESKVGLYFQSWFCKQSATAADIAACKTLFKSDPLFPKLRP